MKLLVVAFASLISVGCLEIPDAPPQPAPAGFEDAENAALKIIWHDVYGRPWKDGDTLWTYEGPAIFWHYGDVCDGQPGFKSPDGAGYGPGQCDQGEYHDQGLNETVGYYEHDSSFIHANAADIEWRGSMSASCLAHELGHALQWYTTGDADNHHASDTFKGSSWCHGVEGSRVYEADQALQAAGL